MKNIYLTITFDKGLEISLRKKWFRDNMEKILKLVDIAGPVELSLLITDDIEIQKLNREHRNIDKATDVLSFQMSDQKTKDGFITPPDGIIHLGEIIISLETAKRDSIDQSISMEDELIFLMVHGALHLLGYDHNNNSDERIMRRKEKEIISAF
jgi:probable rRNA maturation factor